VIFKILMNNYNDKTYWIAVSHLFRWGIERLNLFIIKIIHEHKMSWDYFFELDKEDWKQLFDFTENELFDLESIKKDMPRFAFIVEQLQAEGFQIIPINSVDYPKSLKDNLRVKGCPPVLYTKGRVGLLQEDVIAIVGSRKAGPISLRFTDNIARKSVKEGKVVVSGFAKGVDQQALNSALEADGKSIIVLPQGIMTFKSGFRKYYEPIVNGNVLVLSTFLPQVGWSVGLAMARNAYIYGLAKEIYVAESDVKGGTWSGVVDGLKRHRKIYVRYPEPQEKNANLKLIGLGGLPVDSSGLIIENNLIKDCPDDVDSTERSLLELLSKGEYTSKEILIALNLDWDSRKMTTFLKSNPNVKVFPGRPMKFTRNESVSLSLFS
jgi:predicted Rossmann fold nucleotide-binding protein DprA/Smf involved in DNA uptake